MSIPAPYARAISRYAPKVDRAARRRYGISGAALLTKTLKGESGFDMGAVSKAGARGAAQFMPGTRQGYIDRYGIDPWKDPDSAVHAMSIFLRQSGLEGYNPGGGQGYVNYILGQHVGNVNKQLGGRGAPARGGGGRPSPASVGGAAGGLPAVDTGGGQGVAALLSALQAESRPSLPMSVPQAPSSGRDRYLHMPAVPSGGGLQPADKGPGVGEILAALAGDNGDMPGSFGAGAGAQVTGGRKGGRPHPAATKHGSRVVTFDNKPVAGWIAEELAWARDHGWTGSVTEGVRSNATQRRYYNEMLAGKRAGPVAKPGTSHHRSGRYPLGAVDVSQAQQLAQILAKKPGGSPLKWAGGADPPHFSHPFGGGY